MKTPGILLLLILISGIETEAQKISFGIQSGKGQYKMDEIKDLNEYLSGSLPFKTKIISNCPTYFYFQPFVGFSPSKRIETGLFITFHSTGSRISLQDYSGSFLFDIRLKCYTPGIYGEYFFNQARGFAASIYNEAGLIFSEMSCSESLTIGAESVTETMEFKSMNFFMEPGIKVKYSLKHLTLGLSIGYFEEFGNQKFHSESNKDVLLNKNRQPISANWSGLRTGLSLSINIGKYKA